MSSFPCLFCVYPSSGYSPSAAPSFSKRVCGGAFSQCIVLCFSTTSTMFPAFFLIHPSASCMFPYPYSQSQYACSNLQLQDISPTDRIGSRAHRYSLLLRCRCPCLLRVLEYQVASLLFSTLSSEQEPRPQEKSIGSSFTQLERNTWNFSGPF